MLVASIWVYYGLALLLTVANALAWLLNLVALPGNWVMVLFSMLFVGFAPPTHDGPQISWATIGILLGLAITGELVEFLASAAGAASRGGSKRSTILSVIGTLVGSFCGLAMGLPVPVVGPAIAAIAGGALGAFAGAYIGERWKGMDASHRTQVAWGAFSGRLWGMAGKLTAGTLMFVIVTFDCLF